MFNIYSLEKLARDRQESALAEANRERLLHEGRRPQTGDFELFNHYHFWPQRPEKAAKPEGRGPVSWGKPGLFLQLVNSLIGRAGDEPARQSKGFPQPG